MGREIPKPAHSYLPEPGERDEEDARKIAELDSTLAALIETAQSDQILFARALRSFAQRRRHATYAERSNLSEDGWRLLSNVPVLDHLRGQLGASWSPQEMATTWPLALFLAVDEVVDALTLLRMDLTAPAALAARNLLERWTLNVANHHGVERLQGENDAAFITRAWHVYAPIGASTSVGAWWETLSEICHGRVSAGRLGAQIVGPMALSTSENDAIRKGIVGVLELCMRQIRGGVDTLCDAAGHDEFRSALQGPGAVDVSGAEGFNLGSIFRDLDFFYVFSDGAQSLVSVAEEYRQIVHGSGEFLATYFETSLTFRALLERRGRSVERARAAFEAESELLDLDFNPGFLIAKLFRFACFSELSRLLVERTATEPEKVALITAAQALDGAVRAWLEDSDLSLGCLRIVLEQTARLRVHRRRGARARALEDRQSASPSRWIEAAGWKRLSVIVKAMSEFSHISKRTRRSGAREALLGVQGENGRAELSRGAVLEAISHLLAFELRARLAEQDASAAAAFEGAVTLVDEATHLETLERYLERAHKLRDFDFGDSDWAAD